MNCPCSNDGDRGDTPVSGCRVSCRKFCRTTTGDDIACSINRVEKTVDCKKCLVFQNDLLPEASCGALFAFICGHDGKRLNAEGFAGPKEQGYVAKGS